MGCRQPFLFAGLMVLASTVPGFAAEPFAAEPFAGGLLAELLADGVAIGQESVCLTPPQADPRLPEDELAAAQRELSGGRGWAQFTRDSIVAPVHMDLNYLKGANGDRVGQRAHFAFVVHAALQTLRDDDLMQQMFTAETDASEREGFRAEAIDQQALTDQGFEVKNGSTYGWLETTLLNKIALTGVMRSERMDASNFFAVAWKLDDRFSGRQPAHTRYRNEWSKLDRDELGNLTRGRAMPYAGTAGYLIVSPVVGLEGASLIEAEVVLHEPKEWFSGSNLLRSKLPLIIQESARRLRRGLK